MVLRFNLPVTRDTRWNGDVVHTCLSIQSGRHIIKRCVEDVVVHGPLSDAQLIMSYEHEIAIEGAVDSMLEELNRYNENPLAAVSTLDLLNEIVSRESPRRQ